MAACEVELTEECEAWYEALDDRPKIKVTTAIDLLVAKGVTLGHPFSSDIRASRYPEMRELRIQVGGKPFRILYAFDPRQVAVLLVGGEKTGDEVEWYKKHIRIADRLFGEHLAFLKPVDKPKGRKERGRG